MQKSENLGIPFRSLFGKSHRSQKEQIVGLILFILIYVFLLVLNHALMNDPNLKSLAQKLPSGFNEWGFIPIWVTIYAFSIIGIWGLWRKCSLRTLKLEISLLLASLFLNFSWYLLFFLFSEVFLALVDLLLLSCTLLLTIIVFWKKETLSAILFLPFLLWVLFMGSMNMLLCMSL